MLSGIPQVAQIGPSLVAKNGTPFCLFTGRGSVSAAANIRSISSSEKIYGM